MESKSAFQPKEVPNSQGYPSPHPVCFHQHRLHYHWVYPPFICHHSCPASSLPISPKTNQSNASNTVNPSSETTNASVGCVQCPKCFFVPRHPHHYVFPPCMRPPCPPMPSSCPANTAYVQSHFNTSGHAQGDPTASHIGAEIWHRQGDIHANQDGAVENAYELEEEEEEEEEPIFVLTDEWMEFFAKSEARRQQKKKQQQKEAKKLRKAARSAAKKHDGEVEISDSVAHSADASSSALS